jgi:hypothetical protein
MPKFVKARFTDGKGNYTAGPVFEKEKIWQSGGWNVQEISRAFPYSESMKMVYLQVSPEYDTFDEAFAHEFDKEVAP